MLRRYFVVSLKPGFEFALFDWLKGIILNAWGLDQRSMALRHCELGMSSRGPEDGGQGPEFQASRGASPLSGFWPGPFALGGLPPWCPPAPELRSSRREVYCSCGQLLAASQPASCTPMPEPHIEMWDA